MPEEEYLIPFGQADIKRKGDAVTVITWGQGVPVALKAAELAAAEDLSCEVIDLRSIRPMDEAAIIASVKKTNRAVIVYHGWPTGGVGGDIVARIQELAFDDLDAPVLRVCYEDLPMPYAENLENLILPLPSAPSRPSGASRTSAERRTWSRRQTPWQLWSHFPASATRWKRA